MNAAEAMQVIESLEFGAVVNIASTFKTFVRVMTAQPAVQQLLADMNRPGIPQEVLQRALSSPAAAK